MNATDKDYFSFQYRGATLYVAVEQQWTGVDRRFYGLRIIGLEHGVQVETYQTDSTVTDTYMRLYDADSYLLASNGDIDYSTTFSRIIYNPGELTVTPSSVTIPASSRALVDAINITGYARILIPGQPYWLTTYSQNPNTVNLNTYPNLDTVPRTATIRFTNGIYNRFVNVTQLASPPCTDAYEPNNSRNTAYQINPNSYLTSLCLSPGDEDYFRVSYNGRTYYIRVALSATNQMSGKYDLICAPTNAYDTNAGEGFYVRTQPNSSTQTNADTELFLYDANGVLITSNDNYNNTVFSYVFLGIRVNPSSLTFDSPAPRSQTITITTIGNWTLTNLPVWISASATTGTGNSTITLTTLAATDSFPRTATLTFSNGIGTLTCVVTQSGTRWSACSDRYEPNDSYQTAANIGPLTNGQSLRLDSLCQSLNDVDIFSFTYNGVPLYATVNRSYYANNTNAIGAYGLSISADSNYRLTITTFPVGGSITDTYIELRNEDQSFLTGNDGYGTSLFSQLIYDFSIRAQPDSFRFGATGGFLGAAVNTNFPAQLSNVPSWLTVQTNLSNPAGSININAPANTDSVERRAVLLLSSRIATKRLVVIQYGSPTANTCSDILEPNNTLASSTSCGYLRNSIYSYYTNQDLCLSPGDVDYFNFFADNSDTRYPTLNYYVGVTGANATARGAYGVYITKTRTGVTIRTFSVNGSQTDTKLTLYDRQGNVLATNDNFNGQPFSQIEYAFPLYVTPARIEKSYFHDYQTINVGSMYNWQISSLPQWIIPFNTQAMQGTAGNTAVYLELLENSDTTPRTGIIVFADSISTATVTVTQGGLPPSYTCVDRYEPNNTLATATNIGNLVSGGIWQSDSACLSRSNDADLYRFSYNNVIYYAKVNLGRAGFVGNYRLQISANANIINLAIMGIENNTSADTYLTLLSANDSILAVNDNIFGTNGYLTYLSAINYNITLPNDDVCGAIVLTATNTPNCLSATTSGATTSTYPPFRYAGCVGCKDVWFTCLIPASGVVTIRTTAGTVTDAYMAIYEVDQYGGIKSDWTLYEDDNNNPGANGSFMPVLTMRGTPGNRLFIRIWDFRGGTFNICALDYDTPNIVGGGGGQNNAIRANRSNTPTLRAYPNPVSQQLQVVVQSPVERETSIELYDVLGRKVLAQNAALQIGENQQSINVSTLASGLYLLQVGDERLKIQIAR